MHLLWILCLLIRIGLCTNYIGHKYLNVISFFIGIGFLYKAYTGSNDEYQIAKVFWHETRYLHGILFLTSSFYGNNLNNYKIMKLIIILDVCFSILYRINIFQVVNCE